jgi:hypothetical protein
MELPDMSEATSNATIIPSAWDDMQWIPLDYVKEACIPGPAWKLLFEDPQTGGMTYLMHIPPGWHDPQLDYHPSTEESYHLEGTVTLGDRRIDAECALYRPPYILHGPVTVQTSFTGLQRTSAPLQMMRYTDGPGHHLMPITDDYKDWPVEWSERIDVNGIPFAPVTEGGWAGVELKWVYQHKGHGGGCVMIDIPAGWEGTGSPARGALEEFLIEGDLTAGGVAFGRWGYAQRPAGEPAGTYASRGGARLLCYWNGANEL